MTSGTDITDLVAVASVSFQLLAVFMQAELEPFVLSLIPLPPYHAPPGSASLTGMVKRISRELSRIVIGVC